LADLDMDFAGDRAGTARHAGGASAAAPPSRRGAAGRPIPVPATARSAGGLVAQLGFWSGQASFFVVLALYLQQGRGLRPLPAGLVFTILAVAYLAASVAAPSLVIAPRPGG